MQTPAHHKLESMARKNDFIYQHEIEVLLQILEEEKVEETQITLEPYFYAFLTENLLTQVRI